MIRTASIFMAIALACTMAFADRSVASAGDEAGVKAVSQAFTAAFNHGDASAVAELWIPDGEYVTQEGKPVKGHEAIKAMYEALFKESKGVTVKTTPSGIRFEKPDMAVEEGTATVTWPDKVPSESRYKIIQVKYNGKWHISKIVEELDTTVVSAYTHLKELEWLIGEWIDKDDHAEIDTTNTWTENKCFIASSFKVKPANGMGLSGTMVIGWDPIDKKIKSWVFDSSGAVGQGVWVKDGNTWTVNMVTTLSSGQTASSINTYKYVDKNKFTWNSTSREVDGTPLPAIQEATVVRKTAAGSTSESTR